MGKPKKAATSTASTKDDLKKKPELLGKKIKYIGLLGAKFTCKCGRSFRKGMVSEYQGILYCSEDCIKK